MNAPFRKNRNKALVEDELDTFCVRNAKDRERAQVIRKARPQQNYPRRNGGCVRFALCVTS
jgi:hypothetical protein